MVLGFEGINEVRQGKYFEIDINENSETKAKEKIEEMCKNLLVQLMMRL